MGQLICYFKTLLITVFFFSLFACTTQQTGKTTLSGEQLVIDFVQMWNSKDLSKIDLIFTKDCVYDDVPALTTYYGIDEVKASLQEDFAWCSDLKLKLFSSLVTENGAVIEWIWSGTHTGNIDGLIKATGKSFSIRGTSVMKFKNGKIKKNSDYYDAGELLHQLGVKLVLPSGKVLGETQFKYRLPYKKKEDVEIQMIQQTPKKAAIDQSEDKSSYLHRLEQTRNKLKQALLNNDIEILERIWADDYVLTTRTGKVLTKSQRIASLKSGKLRYLKAKESDVEIRLYGNTAVVTGQSATLTNRDEKEINSGPKRFTEVFIFQEELWWMVARHATTIYDTDKFGTQLVKKWQDEKQQETDKQAIKQIHNIAAKAVKEGDVATYVNLFTKDGIYLWPDIPAIVGRESLQAWFEKRFSEYSAELEKTIEEIEIFGDWAFERGSEVSKIRNRSTDEIQVVQGKFINIFQKQNDGSWKIARRIRSLDHQTPK